MKTHFMNQALELALKGEGKASPNPMVGAVIVKDDRIIGEGFYTYQDKIHAEVKAIHEALKKGYSLERSTLYVTLEPCSHEGRTHACTEAIIEANITSVAVGMMDPDKRVCGQGIEKLKSAGINVEKGVLEKQCVELNRAYIKHRTKNLPYVILKIAATLDGRIADAHGRSQWITGAGARCYAHRLRNEVDAILVGVNTVTKDNPKLTVRLPGVEKNPLRIILDSHLNIPLSSHVLNDEWVSKTLIITLDEDVQKREAVLKKGAKIVTGVCEDGRISLLPLMENLAQEGIVSVLIEGGASTNTSFLKQGLVDQLDYFFAPKILGSDGLNSIAKLGIENLDKVLEFKDYSFEKVGNDLLFEGFL